MGKGGSTVEDVKFSLRDDTIIHNPPKTKPLVTQTELVRIEADDEASDDDDSDFSESSSELGASTDDELISISEELIGDGGGQYLVAARNEGDPISTPKISDDAIRT